MIHTNTLITVLKASHQALGPCPTTTQYYDLKTQKQQTELSMIHCSTVTELIHFFFLSFFYFYFFKKQLLQIKQNLLLPTSTLADTSLVPYRDSH